jgi:hypothetical protein
LFPTLGLFLTLGLFPALGLCLTLGLLLTLRPGLGGWCLSFRPSFLLLGPPLLLLPLIALRIGRSDGFQQQGQDTNRDQSRQLHGHDLPHGECRDPARGARKWHSRWSPSLSVIHASLQAG